LHFTQNSNVGEISAQPKYQRASE